MMAMKFFQPSLRLSRELEFDIWREANLVETYGTSKEGLALAAARRGFHVYTMGMPLRHSFVDAIADKNPSIDYTVLELLYGDRKKFRGMGLRNINSRIQPYAQGGFEEVTCSDSTNEHVPVRRQRSVTALDCAHGIWKRRLASHNPLAKSGSSILSCQKLVEI